MLTLLFQGLETIWRTSYTSPGLCVSNFNRIIPMVAQYCRTNFNVSRYRECEKGKHLKSLKDKTRYRSKKRKCGRYTSVASFPFPRPAFCRLQYGKAGRAWYISSRDNDVIDERQNEDAMFCVIFNHLHVQCLVSMSVAPH